MRDAILQCPVGAIKWTKRPKILSSSTKKNHTHTPTPLPKLTDGYPKLLEDNVYLAGPPSRALFGGASYFIKGGGQNGKENILIDTPDASPEIVERIKKMGGVSYIVFTHVDHVGLHEEWKKAFPGVERVMHADDFNEGTKGFEIMLQGSNSGSSDGSGGTKEIQTDTHTHSSSDDNEKGKKKLVGTVTAAVAALFSSSSPSRSPSSPSPSTTTISSPPPLTCTLPGWEKDLKLIHAPGHTPGCIFILYKDKFLFTGDSLQYSRVTGGGHLVGYRLHW